MTAYHAIPEDEPRYFISVAARIIGVHAQTLRYYERLGIITPSRSQGRTRLYSQRDLERIRRIKSLTDELGLSLAGAGVMLRLVERIALLEERVQNLTSELETLRGETNNS
jgi:MerR family transcriptional regulator/heat shock protein HspR